MKPAQNFPCPEQLGLNFNPIAPQTDPVIWQWHQLPPQLRNVIVEWAGFNSKTIKRLPKKDAVELEPWLKCTLNWTMGLMSRGVVDLRFD